MGPQCLRTRKNKQPPAQVTSGTQTGLWPRADPKQTQAVAVFVLTSWIISSPLFGGMCASMHLGVCLQLNPPGSPRGKGEEAFPRHQPAHL